jgi:hypothetical protein
MFFCSLEAAKSEMLALDAVSDQRKEGGDGVLLASLNTKGSSLSSPRTRCRHEAVPCELRTGDLEQLYRNNTGGHLDVVVVDQKSSAYHSKSMQVPNYINAHPESLFWNTSRLLAMPMLQKAFMHLLNGSKQHGWAYTETDCAKGRRFLGLEAVRDLCTSG